MYCTWNLPDFREGVSPCEDAYDGGKSDKMDYQRQ